MNQDDSILVPSRDTAGRSLFGLGDYRYSANLRIGSSRSDNFGSAENLKATDEVLRYLTWQQLLLNPEFTTIIDPWLQIGSDTAWVHPGGSGVIISGTPTAIPNGDFASTLAPSTSVGVGNAWTWSGAFSGCAFSTLPSSLSPTQRLRIPFATVAGETYKFELSFRTNDGGGGAGDYTDVKLYLTDGVDFSNVQVRADLPLGTTTFEIEITATANQPYIEITAESNDVAGQDREVLVLLIKNISDFELITNTIYQPLTLSQLANGVVVFHVKANDGSIGRNGLLELVFLNGTTELSTEVLAEGVITELEDDLLVTIPINCDGIGIRLSGSATPGSGSGTFEFELLSIEFNSWATGSAPGGTEKTVGHLEDKEFLKHYYANWNSGGYHTIRVYDYTTDTIFELLRWSGLDFIESSFIKFAKLDNWLGFVDSRRTAPRLIDVDTISDLYLQLGSDFREFHIAFHKWAPTAPPIPRVYYDTVTNNFDKLKNKTYQFSHRYVYNGNLKSRFSPISKAAAIPGNTGDFYAANTITSIEVEVAGHILDVPGAAVEYNYFDHDSDKFCKAVDYIEIVFRDSELSPWLLWKRIYKNTGGTFDRYHYFNGDFDGRIVGIQDFIQPFDTVPILAGTIETVDNRFVFGDCLDENEPARVRFEDIGTLSAGVWNTSLSASYPQFSATPTLREKLQRFNALSAFKLKERAKYKLAIQFGSHTGWRSLGYTTDDFLFEINADTDDNALKFTIPSDILPPEWATWYQILRSNAIGIDYFMIGSANSFTPVFDKASALLALDSLPSSIKDRLAQHFENSSIVNGYEIKKEIDLALEGKSKILNVFENIIADKSGVSERETKALQRYIKTNPLFNKIGPEVRDSQTEAVLTNASRIFIDINNWYNAAQETGTKNYPQSNMFYNYRKGDGINKGDRVRFYASTIATPLSASDISVYDEEIIEFSGTGIIVNKPVGVLSIPNAAITAIWASFYEIEVYTPRTTQPEDNLLFECGEWYPVLYPGKSNRDFAKRDWVYSGSNNDVTVESFGPFDVFSKIPFYFGDCFKINKPFYRDLAVAATINLSMNPDPDRTYGFWERNNGRPGIAYLDLPVKKFIPTKCRFGGKIVEESSINALNRFREEDNKIFPSEYGRIRDLVNTSNAQVESVGSILLAIGEREAWSIYVNRTTLEDLSGRTQVSLSDQVLGSYNTLLGSHGTLNPESISKERGNVYWFDVLSGTWVRYGRDGLTEISSYKMRNWFRELANLIVTLYGTDEVPRVISEYDPFNDELITLINHSGLPETFRGYSTYKGALFSEEDTRWKSIHSYVAEFFGKIGILVLAFKDGRLYKLEYGSNAFIIQLDEWDNTFAANPLGVTGDAFIEAIASGSNWGADQPILLPIPLNATIAFPVTIEITGTWTGTLTITFTINKTGGGGIVSGTHSINFNANQGPTAQQISILKNLAQTDPESLVINISGTATGTAIVTITMPVGESVYTVPYNTFFGTKFDSLIEPVFNDASMNVKSWQDIAVTTTNKWSVERILSEYRGIKTKQETRILIGTFDDREDNYYAAIPNDLNTPNKSNPIVEGDKMRSKAIQTLMKLDPAVTTLSLLHYVTVGYIDSPKNPLKL